MTERPTRPLALFATLVAFHSGSALAADPAKNTEGNDKPPAYEDRLIDGGGLTPLISEGDEAPYNAAGRPRSWRFEGFSSNFDRGGINQHENGMAVSGRYDTQDYGAFSLDATVRDSGNGNIVTLWQRGMPLDNGWRANNGIGMLNTLGIDLSRTQYRFYIPTFPIVGAVTEFVRGNDTQWQASLGEPGVYNGIRLPGFSRLGGTLFTAGMQTRLTPQVQAGVQFADANNVQDSFDPAAAARFSARSWYGTFAWEDSGTRVQGNVLDSRVGGAGHHLGVWLDAETRSGRYRHDYGAYRLDRDLAWGYLPINSDSQGGYYRVNYHSQQWIWSAGLDAINSLSGAGTDSYYGTGTLRYQYSRSLGLGGGLTVRHSGTDAEAAYAFIDKDGPLGTTRMQFDAAKASSQHSEQLTVDQTWPTQIGLRLSTSLSLGREVTGDQRVTRMSAAAFGGIDLGHDITLDGNVRFSYDRGGTSSNGRYANLSLSWRINSQWSLSTTYYDNRSEEDPFLSVATLVPTQLVTPVQKDRALFIIVRYEDRAGSPTAPLGGAPGSGAGNIEGYLFYDANDDGRRDASEAGAPNVTVLLDGRYAARTDPQGKFEFPFVASGRHTLTVVPDNLALSWSVSGDARREIVVRTRELTRVDIPASRIK